VFDVSEVKYWRRRIDISRYGNGKNGARVADLGNPDVLAQRLARVVGLKNNVAPQIGNRVDRAVVRAHVRDRANGELAAAVVRRDSIPKALIVG
jgi:hypothetical protein